MYDWKITLDNKKQYIVISEHKNVKDFDRELFGIDDNGKAPMMNLNGYKLSENDENYCNDVVINSSKVCSIEFNFKQIK